MLTFQQLVQTLTDFWEKQGCVIHFGHDLETGAGTFNPATFLRCLGPEPYKAAYVEPSRRPADGRFGENPNRVQLFHQYQVVIKPSPPDIQQTYLKSLEAIGLDLKKHDIRFVHDDWESPTLGAWGLGWEVWCDGMEITQWTYFQAIASTPLNPPSVEITYGLERLAMFVQNKEDIFDIQWNKELTLRDISHRHEVEWSAYNFTEASTTMWLRHFEDYEKEAKQLLAKNLPIPAYDFVIKASHAFNLLDARGAISVTERTGYIARIRDLSRLVATCYIASREALGFPLLGKEKDKPLKKLPPLKKAPPFHPKKTQDFLLEIGSEQLPASFVSTGSAHLEGTLRTWLEEQGLKYEALRSFATPQRLALLVKGLVEGTEEKVIERRGPAVATAFAEKGKPTPQGLGFLKSLGCEGTSLAEIRKGKQKNLKIVEIKGVEYLFATLYEKGKSTFALLAEHLPRLILSIDFPKKMRWGTLDISYARPLRWTAALFGDKVIPFQVGDILSDRISYGHAQRDPGPFPLKKAQDYRAQLKKRYVLADVEERKSSILTQLRALEKKLGGKVIGEHRVLSEVLHLVEWPELAAATFDPRFLKAPKEVLISEMIEHQRYFPIAKDKDTLKNAFIITADTVVGDLVRKGNQRVLSARLNDGVFLYEQDLKIPLEKFNEKLRSMTFQKELGSMQDKVLRLSAIAQMLNEHLEIADQRKLLRAALLSKADLASALVGEFPELQGTAGKYYALVHKEDTEVAQAIEEHWMPRSEHAPLPRSPVGIVLSLADKIDNLLSFYSIGLKPTSSSDPYALRRQAIGLIKVLLEEKKSVDLRRVLQDAAARLPSPPKDPKAVSALIEEVLHFITSRAKGIFEDYRFKKDEIEASVRSLCTDPHDQFCKLLALHEFRKSGSDFAKLFEVYKRAKGQLEKPTRTPFNPELAKEAAERSLLQELDTVHKHWTSALKERDYLKAFHLIARLQPYIAKLFDTVKILDENIALRENRIALLQKVFALFSDLLDFSKIQEHT